MTEVEVRGHRWQLLGIFHGLFVLGVLIALFVFIPLDGRSGAGWLAGTVGVLVVLYIVLLYIFSSSTVRAVRILGTGIVVMVGNREVSVPWEKVAEVRLNISLGEAAVMYKSSQGGPPTDGIVLTKAQGLAVARDARIHHVRVVPE
jgi:hypothetical protein